MSTVIPAPSVNTMKKTRACHASEISKSLAAVAHSLGSYSRPLKLTV